MKRFSTADFTAKKQSGQKIAMITAYDYTSAKIIEESDIETILVGDSLGNVVLGYDTTVPVTLEDMIYHTKAVVRGNHKSMIISDLPFLTYHTGIADALRNAARLLQEGGAQAVKLEGGRERAETVRTMVEAGIPVIGHLGLTPQSVYQLGGFKVQGKSNAAAQKLLDDAISLQEAGAFALVLECIPADLAKIITESLQISTIGIGAGPDCDGQVLVFHDMLGMNMKVPKFVKQYGNLHEQMLDAFRTYKNEVELKLFPGKEHSY